MKMSFRGAKRRGNPFSPYDKGAAGVGGASGTPPPTKALQRVRCVIGRRGEGTPPYGCVAGMRRVAAAAHMGAALRGDNKGCGEMGGASALPPQQGGQGGHVRGKYICRAPSVPA